MSLFVCILEGPNETEAVIRRVPIWKDEAGKTTGINRKNPGWELVVDGPEGAMSLGQGTAPNWTPKLVAAFKRAVIGKVGEVIVVGED